MIIILVVGVMGFPAISTRISVTDVEKLLRYNNRGDKMKSDKFSVESRWSYDGFFENPITFEVLNNNGNIKFRQLSGECIDVVYGNMEGYFSFGSTMYQDSQLERIPK